MNPALNKELEQNIVKAAKKLIDDGYANAPKFCEQEPCTPLELLIACTRPISEPKTGNQTLIDVGAIRWCMEQLDGGDGIDHAWCDGVCDE